MRRQMLALAVRASCLVASVVALGAPAAGAEQDPRTRKKKEVLKLALEAPRVRSHAPARLRVTFDWTGTRLLEGYLELRVHTGTRLLTTYRSPEVALTTGERTFDFLLPALASELSEPMARVTPTFVTKQRHYGFEPTDWIVPHILERSCVVGITRMELGWDEVLRATRQGLRLETFRVRNDKTRDRNLDTKFVHLAASSFPATPLSYCSYDVLLLGGRGLLDLRERQLTAIARWVRAGGSVCVAPSGALEQRHTRFLNDLAGIGPAFQLGTDGMLLPPDPTLVGQQDAGSCRLHCGLGRLVVLVEPPRKVEGLATPAWRRTACFLWKVRSGQTDRIASTGTWLQEGRGAGDADWYDPRHEGLRVSVQPVIDAASLLSGLMPESVHVLPFGLVVVILVAFVVAIGPVDYWLLGLLRLRRFTWVFFPIMAGAFTLFTIRLTERYMGGVDEIRSLVFVDVEPNGTALRESRYDLHFTAGERTVHYDMHNALIYAMARGGRMDRRREERGFGDGSMAALGSDSVDPLTYEGLLPSRYKATFRYQQYRPQLNRAFSLEPSESPPDLDWGAVTLKKVADSNNPYRLAEELYRGRRPAGSVYFLFGSRIRCLHPMQQPRALLVTSRTGEMSLLHRACVRPRESLFYYVSQISPNGAPNFEDLALLDPDDAKQWMVVVVEERDEHVYVYRCLYRGGP